MPDLVKQAVGYAGLEVSTGVSVSVLVHNSKLYGRSHSCCGGTTATVLRPKSKLSERRKAGAWSLEPGISCQRTGRSKENKQGYVTP
jgi:hypothetical protein